MNYLFLSVIIAVLLLVELVIIAPTLIKRTARLKKNATGGDIVLSRKTKVCLLVEMALRGLLIILQIVLAVMSKEYSLEAALLLFGVGQILGHGIGVVITLTSVCLLVITRKKERETQEQSAVAGAEKVKFVAIPPSRFLMFVFALPVLLLLWGMLLLAIQYISDPSAGICVQKIIRGWPLSIFVLAYEIVILNLQRVYTIQKDGITVKTLFHRRKYTLWEEFRYVGPVEQTLHTENMPGGRSMKGSRKVLVCTKTLPYKEHNNDLGYKVAKDSVFIPYTRTNCDALKKWCPRYSETFYGATDSDV